VDAAARERRKGFRAYLRCLSMIERRRRRWHRDYKRVVVTMDPETAPPACGRRDRTAGRCRRRARDAAARETIDASGCVCMPGLVNAHTICRYRPPGLCGRIRPVHLASPLHLSEEALLDAESVYFAALSRACRGDLNGTTSCPTCTNSGRDASACAGRASRPTCRAPSSPSSGFDFGSDERAEEARLFMKNGTAMTGPDPDGHELPCGVHLVPPVWRQVADYAVRHG
jgi:cytosine/adenosine deaminase-related metal-dependent hydrolase